MVKDMTLEELEAATTVEDALLVAFVKGEQCRLMWSDRLPGTPATERPFKPDCSVRVESFGLGQCCYKLRHWGPPCC